MHPFETSGCLEHALLIVNGRSSREAHPCRHSAHITPIQVLLAKVSDMAMPQVSEAMRYLAPKVEGERDEYKLHDNLTPRKGHGLCVFKTPVFSMGPATGGYSVKAE